jgi:hypothetical protein
MSNEYYVYLYIDPQNNLPFYVGKGKGSRASDHLQRSRLLSENTRKDKKIKELITTGFQPIIKIYSSGLTNDESLRLESELILILGRFDLDENGILTNVLTGGDDPPNNKGRKFPNRKSPTFTKPKKRWTEEQKEKQRLRMKEFMSNPHIRQKCSDAKKGKPGHSLTDETKKKLSIAQKNLTEEQKKRK